MGGTSGCLASCCGRGLTAQTCSASGGTSFLWPPAVLTGPPGATEAVTPSHTGQLSSLLSPPRTAAAASCEHRGRRSRNGFKRPPFTVEHLRAGLWERPVGHLAMVGCAWPLGRCRPHSCRVFACVYTCAHAPSGGTWGFWPLPLPSKTAVATSLPACLRLSVQTLLHPPTGVSSGAHRQTDGVSWLCGE